MWPSRLPAQVLTDRYRAAEVRVFEQLKRSLSSDWVVFYSRPWLGLTPTGAERDGECDFVIAHAKHGFLAVEVKGGGISYDPEKDLWESRDRHGIRHRIKNPVEQARSAKHELLKRLRVQRGWPKKRFIRFRHGVIFPDVDMPPGSLGADRPRALFCCRKDLASIDKWVAQRLSGGDEDDLGRDGIHEIERLLAAPIALKMPLANILADDDEAIACLTPQQFHILDAISALRRVAIGGGARTGKTVLAIEDALRHAESGRRTLLTCLSEQLAVELRKRLQDSPVVVETFVSLCTRAAGPECSSKFSDAESPESLLLASKQNPEFQFDAVIVDEAQDFRSHWWIALDGLLRDQSTSDIHAFYDTNQSVYGDVAGELAGFQLVPIHLSRNLRNTQIIHELTEHFYSGLPITADGPEGLPINWVSTNEDDITTKTFTEVQRLVKTEKTPNENLAVLTTSDTESEVLKHKLKMNVGHGLTIDTIASFKGLERSAVVIAAYSGIADEPELAYVAFSRARTFLSVIGTEPVLDWLKTSPATNSKESRRK